MTWIKYDESLSALRYMYSIHIIEIVYANSLYALTNYITTTVFSQVTHILQIYLYHTHA